MDPDAASTPDWLVRNVYRRHRPNLVRGGGGETHGRCKQNVSDCIPDLPGPRKNPAGDGSGCITVSDDAVRDAGEDTVLYIIPGDSAAPYSRLWIEESNCARSVTPRRYYQVDMSTAGLGEGWAATHMAAIKAVSMRDADAEIYRYIYIKKKEKKRQSSLRELGVYFVR